MFRANILAVVSISVLLSGNGWARLQEKNVEPWAGNYNETAEKAGEKAGEKVIGVWVSRFDNLFSEISLLNREAEGVAKKKLQELVESSRMDFELKGKDLRESLGKAKKKKITLEEEEELEKKTANAIKSIDKERDLALAELSKAIESFNKTGLFPVTGDSKLFNNLKNDTRQVLIDIYAEYDYKRILYWQFLAQTTLDLEEIGNITRDRNLYSEAKLRLKRLHDVDQVKLVYQTFTGAMIYSVLKNGTGIRPISQGPVIKQPMGNSTIRTRELGQVKVEYQTPGSGSIISEGLVEFKTVNDKLYSRRVVFSGSSEFYQKIEIKVPQGEKTVFGFKFGSGEGEIDAEIEGFEKDLHSIRALLIPKIFGGDYEPRITKRPATLKIPSDFEGIYKVMELSVDGKFLSDQVLASAKAVWKLPSIFVVQYDSKEKNWLIKIDETNGITDIYEIDPEGGMTFHPALFTRRGNSLVFQIGRPGKPRPKSDGSILPADIEKLQIRKFQVPELKVSRLNPEVQPAENETVLIDVHAKDSEMGPMRIEYKLDDNDWQALVAIDGKYGPVEFEKIGIGNHKVKFRALSVASGLTIEKEVAFIARKLVPPTIDFSLKSGKKRLNYGEEATITVSAVDPEKGECVAEWKSGDGAWKRIGKAQGKYEGELSVGNMQLGENNFQFRSFSVKTKKYSEEKKYSLLCAIPTEWKGKCKLLTNRPQNFVINFKIKNGQDYSDVGDRIIANGIYTSITDDNRMTEYVFNNSYITIFKPKKIGQTLLDFILVEGQEGRPNSYTIVGKFDIENFKFNGRFEEDNVNAKNMKNRDALLKLSYMLLEEKK